MLRHVFTGEGIVPLSPWGEGWGEGDNKGGWKMANDKHTETMEAPGVFVLSLVFLAVFIIIWLAHLKWLVDLWGVK